MREGLRTTVDGRGRIPYAIEPYPIEPYEDPRSGARARAGGAGIVTITSTLDSWARKNFRKIKIRFFSGGKKVGAEGGAPRKKREAREKTRSIGS